MQSDYKLFASMRIVSDIAVFVLKCDIKLQPPTNLGREKKNGGGYGSVCCDHVFEIQTQPFCRRQYCLLLLLCYGRFSGSTRAVRRVCVCVSVCMCGQYLLN